MKLELTVNDLGGIQALRHLDHAGLRQPAVLPQRQPPVGLPLRITVEYQQAFRQDYFTQRFREALADPAQVGLCREIEKGEDQQRLCSCWKNSGAERNQDHEEPPHGLSV